MKLNVQLFTVACLAMVSCLGWAGTLSITLMGLTPGEGTVRVGVFDQDHSEHFPGGEVLRGVEVPATAQEMTIDIPGLAPGEYAIAVTQDLNDNGKLDRNAFAIPKEPYGFSGAWKSRAASFEKALIDTRKDGYAVTIKLKQIKLKQKPVKQKPVKQEPVKQEPAKQEPAKQEPY